VNSGVTLRRKVIKGVVDIVFMFSFIKKLFAKEEAIVQEEVEVEEITSWINGKLKEIDFQENIKEFFNKIKEQKIVLVEKLGVLRAAEIDKKEKDKVEERVKHIVLGHKDSYLREMDRFQNNLVVPEETDLQTAINFNGLLNKKLDILAGKTAKSYQAAQHLFFNPVEDVFKAVGEINLAVKNFDVKLGKKKWDLVKNIQEKIGFLEEEKKKRMRLWKDKDLLEIKLRRCQDGKEKQEKELEELNQSEELKELKELQGEEGEIRKLIKEQEDEVHLFFFKLRRALRKYEKVTMEVKIVSAYLENAVAAFFNDPKLQILGVLEGLGKSLTKGELDLDEKQKSLALELVKEAQEGCLKNILEKRKELEKEEEKLKTKSRVYQIDNLIEEAEYKLDHFNDQILLVQREMKELKAKIDSLGEEKLQQELKELVKKVLKVEVSWV